MLMVAVLSFVAAVSLVLLIFVLKIPARSGFKPVDLGKDGQQKKQRINQTANSDIFLLQIYSTPLSHTHTNNNNNKSCFDYTPKFDFF